MSPHDSHLKNIFSYFSQSNLGVASWSSILSSVWSLRASTTSHFKTLAYIQVRVLEGSLVSWLRWPGKIHLLKESTQERLSRHRILWSHKWPGLGLHAEMWADGPCRGSPRLQVGQSMTWKKDFQYFALHGRLGSEWRWERGQQSDEYLEVMDRWNKAAEYSKKTYRWSPGFEILSQHSTRYTR